MEKLRYKRLELVRGKEGGQGKHMDLGVRELTVHLSPFGASPAG
jgi:hypothetical protein